MAGRNNYDVIISMVNGQLDRMINNHKIDGIIISRSMVDTSAQRSLKEKGIPFVVIGSSSEKDVVCIDNDNMEASRELTEILLMKGMKKLAILGGDETYQVTENRLEGFMRAHRDRGITVDKSVVFMDIDSYAKASRAVEQALALNVDCLVAMDDYVCNLVIECLNEKNINIPSDIRLASLYDSKQLAHNNPPITSLHFNTKTLGENACGTLLEMLGEKLDEDMSDINYQVVLRDSTK